MEKSCIKQNKITNMDIINSNKEYYAANSETYDVNEQPFIHQGCFLASLLKKIGYFNKNSMLLDFGAGTGQSTSLLIDIFPSSEIYGIDISNEALSIAKRKCPGAKLTLFDGIRIPFPSQCFDGVLVSSVLHHILDYKAILLEIIRVCKKDSFIIITQEPNPPFNKIINFIRKIIREELQDLLILSEYHQFNTGGICPEDIFSVLCENGYSVDTIFNNDALLDVLYLRHKTLYTILKCLHKMHLPKVFNCSYNIIGTRS
ncbi:MAG: class I SAM-dependent methyltransferase [Candidatus Omnitrophota bacterium]